MGVDITFMFSCESARTTTQKQKHIHVSTPVIVILLFYGFCSHVQSFVSVYQATIKPKLLFCHEMDFRSSLEQATRHWYQEEITGKGISAD